MTALRSRSGLKDFKFDLLRFAIEISSPFEVAEMFSRIMFTSLRDTFQYTRIEAATLLTALTPKLTDCAQIRELIEATATHRREAFGASQFVADALLQALHARAAQVCPPA
jgi:hypothetical protein